MPHDIVVIGASAGGVEALIQVVGKLPSDLPASVFVTHHFPSGSRSMLPTILTRAGPLEAIHPANGERIRHGMIYVAPPDYHLVLREGCAWLSPGPKENGHRPAIDTMFRSAATAYDGRVIGVILTGMLDDGVAGLMSIKAKGGMAIVQDPEDAFSSSMPSAAIKNVDVDRVAPLAEMGAAIAEVVLGSTSAKGETMDEDSRETIEEEMALGDVVPPIYGPDDVPGELTMYTCPECHGSLWELQENDVLRYRCHVGHSYTQESFLSEKSDELESALWTALRALQEHAVILLRMKERAEGRGHIHSAKRMAENHIEAERRANIIRDVLLKGAIFHPNGNGRKE